MNKKKIIFFSVIILIIFIVVLIVKVNNSEVDIKENEKKEKFGFSPNEIPAGSHSEYDIKLKMDNNDRFFVNSSVNVKNVSKDTWDKVVFYFIPNMFTKKNSPYIKKPANVMIKDITINGQKVSFSLIKDTLSVTLANKLPPNNKISIDIKYQFTLPEDTPRFNRDENKFFLAQWYPMVATYQDGWNKESYRFKGETFHTTFSNFKITYDIPDNITMITTSDTEEISNNNQEYIEAKNVKEFFIALLKKPMVVQKKLDKINIRVFGINKDEKLLKEIEKIAYESLNYFQKTIGPYPLKQLDIVLDSKPMEYPGIVTVDSTGNIYLDGLKRFVVHEIAHQWFYGIISNDPFHSAWLDEGITEFATNLFYARKYNQPMIFDKKRLKKLPLSVNLPLDKYTHQSQSQYIYVKSSMMLWGIFKKNGGILTAEKFIKNYFDLYQYKEVDTKEFTRFLKYYLNIEEDTLFKDWILLDNHIS